MHVRHDSTGGNRCRADELVELFVVLDCQLDVTRVGVRLLVVIGGVATSCCSWLRCHER